MVHERGQDQNQELFEEMCRLLHDGHKQRGYTPEGTLNRLFKKHLNRLKPEIADNPPLLTPRNVRVTIEQLPTAVLKASAPGDRTQAPRHRDFLVVIVRYRGRDCLIDGSKRIHAWYVAGDTGQHAAYVLVVMGAATS